ncbi:MAG: glycerol-3-phosphate acyltransferase [Leptolyngbya sp. PLA3]|nr:MAG: glycerol-3-phosphate acyltransferase [Cyanobacteria bacterium CYA]MCE7967247.1 glycerol-3-phosphate acyltransferase [Leptolyngbya sp. PL-A3]
MTWALGFLFGLAVGSIPFGVIIGRCRGVDIRAAGSHNIGATNVGRLLGFRYFLLCFFLDMLKGLVPTLSIGYVAGTLGRFELPPAHAFGLLAVMIAPVLGHMFSPFVGFRGGKGVATGVGALLGIYPIMTLPAVGGILVFALVLALWRYVSAGSCVAAATIPIWVYLEFKSAENIKGRDEQLLVSDWLTAGGPFLLASAALACLVIWKHRANLGRLLRGTEPRVGRRNAGASRPTPAAQTD